MKYFNLFILCIIISVKLCAQTTNIVVLNNDEVEKFRTELKANNQVQALYDSIRFKAEMRLDISPCPLKIMHYEGLLDTDPRRMETVKSFADINYVVNLIYASYGNNDNRFGKKAKQIILSWAEKYEPTGNPINENKFNAFFWGYYLFKPFFSDYEQNKVENWMMDIAELQMNRKHTPNNNWEAKRCKITGIVGCILNKEELKTYSVKHFKKYISTAYYADGTSRDLKQRDALHYHVSGLKPCLSAFINLLEFDKRFDLFHYISETGSSVEKSVEYVVPYATGEKQRKEWVNTKVKLDKERAAAGLEKYQPGKLFVPEKAYELFEWACYYQPEWKSIFEKNEQISSWVGCLNSSIVRR